MKIMLYIILAIIFMGLMIYGIIDPSLKKRYEREQADRYYDRITSHWEDTPFGIKRR